MLLEECRVQPRCPPHRETVCRLVLAVGGVGGPAAIQNISAGGIGLVLHHPFESGTDVTVELINPAKNFCHRGRVHVVHASLQHDGRWSVGFRFANPLSPEELQALL